MKKLILIITAIVFISFKSVNGQKNPNAQERVLKQIHNVLSDFKYPKDSLLIYALNFTVKIEKRGNKLLASKIIANDSLAYQLFPNYKKLANIDFSSVLGTYTNSDVIIPILIYGSSPEKVKYKDENGQALINFNAAVNSALALVSDKKYDNTRSSYESPGFHKTAKHSKLFRNILVMEPYIVYIANIK